MSKVLFFVLFVALFCTQTVKAALVVSSSVNMIFGRIEYAVGSGFNNAELGTNGNITYTGTFIGGAAGTPAELLITDTVGVIVNIACATSLNISNGAGTIAVDQIQYVIGIGNGVAFGSGQACRGTNKYDLSHTITAVGTQNTLLIGGRLRTKVSSITSGSWGSTNTGGNGVTFSVVVQ